MVIQLNNPNVARLVPTNVLGIVAVGDGSIQAAKARGVIKVVSHFDKSLKNILGIVGKSCTIVYGN